MSKTVDKNLNESLIAFNNHIVSMKNVVKKAKVNQIQRIIKKIKLIEKKKGNESQIEKNKRKCVHLREEIDKIKKQKFNEVAIFAIENESVQLDEYVKKNKLKDIQSISLARIGLSKLVRQSIDKLKNDEKIDGWKKTFIVYKSRLEKRKNWKEKTKLLKELEDKLVVDKSELEKLDNPKQSENVESEADEKKESKPVKLTRKQINELIKKDEESNNSQRQVKFSDSESDQDQQSDQDEEDEISQDYESDDDENDIIKNDKQIKDKNEFLYSTLKSSQDENEERVRKELKPLIISKKPAYMEIKQVDLDQLKDLNEIPIDSKDELVEEETDNIISNEKELMDTDEQIITIKLSEDPFFLDSSGHEINNPKIDYDNNKYYERSKIFNRKYNEFDDDNLMSYSSYDRYKNKKKNLYQSSFKTSLSEEKSNFDSNNSHNFNNRKNTFDNNKKPITFSKNYSENNHFNKNSTNNFRHHRDTNDHKFSNNNKSFRDRNNNNYKKHEEKPTLDVANLHPSWQAKKQMEDKLKAMKFQGKKKTFNDDD